MLSMVTDIAPFLVRTPVGASGGGTRAATAPDLRRLWVQALLSEKAYLEQREPARGAAGRGVAGRRPCGGVAGAGRRCAGVRRAVHCAEDVFRFLGGVASPAGVIPLPVMWHSGVDTPRPCCIHRHSVTESVVAVYPDRNYSSRGRACPTTRESPTPFRGARQGVNGLPSHRTRTGPAHAPPPSTSDADDTPEVGPHAHEDEVGYASGSDEMPAREKVGPEDPLKEMLTMWEYAEMQWIANAWAR